MEAGHTKLLLEQHTLVDTRSPGRRARRSAVSSVRISVAAGTARRTAFMRCTGPPCSAAIR